MGDSCSRRGLSAKRGDSALSLRRPPPASRTAPQMPVPSSGPVLCENAGDSGLLPACVMSLLKYSRLPAPAAVSACCCKTGCGRMWGGGELSFPLLCESARSQGKRVLSQGQQDRTQLGVPATHSPHPARPGRHQVMPVSQGRTLTTGLTAVSGKYPPPTS